MDHLVRQQVTTLLNSVRCGNESARNDLFHLVYDELREIAHQFMRQERVNHTLQPTALVNEAVLRLVGHLPDLVNRRHFFAAAIQAMRRVLVDHARSVNAGKRDNGKARLNIAAAEHSCPSAVDSTFVVELDDSIAQLEKLAPRQAEAFQLWYFGGWGFEEIAEMLEVRPRTIQADIKAAKTWLYSRFCAS